MSAIAGTPDAIVPAAGIAATAHVRSSGESALVFATGAIVDDRTFALPALVAATASSEL